MPRLKNEVGHRYGRLIVIERTGIRKDIKKGGAWWLCKCSCGNFTKVLGDCLRNGDTKSCGCFRRKTCGENHMLPIGEASFNSVYSNIRKRARKRNLLWALTKEQVKHLTKQNCYYCGVRPQQISHNRNLRGDYIYNGLDRVDNSKGYTSDNVVPCCVICNKAKLTMTTEEFKAWICRIYEHFGSKP